MAKKKKNKTPNNIQKTAQQLSGLRLNTKCPETFTDRKKQADKKACRKKVNKNDY